VIYASLGSIEVDWNCRPETLLWVTSFDEGFLAVIGDNLNVKWPMWAPLIELCLNRIWKAVKEDFNDFVRALDRIWLHEYLHIELRCEATQPPAGRGSLPVECKGRDEEKYIFNMIESLMGSFTFGEEK